MGYAKSAPDILVLHSYHNGFTWSDDIQLGIEETLKPLSPRLHIEYLDTKRNHAEEYLQHVTELLKFKLFHNRFDLIIAVDNRALALLNQLAPRYLGETPVLFVGINDFSPQLVNGIRHYSGVEESVDIVEGMKLALSQHPDTNKVYLIIDNSLTGQVVAERLKTDLASFPVDVEILQRYSIEALLAKVSSLKPGGLIYYIFFGLDVNDQFFEPDRVVEQLSVLSLLPIYSSWDFNMVPGVIGGKMISGYLQGKAVAQQALQLLSGLPAKSIPIKRGVSSQIKYDYQELQKWGLSFSDLPAEALIMNKPSDKVEVNSRLLYISLIVSVLLLLAIYYHIMRLTRSKRALQISQSRFDTLLNNATHFSGLIHPDGTIEVVNQAVLSALELSQEQLHTLNFLDLEVWDKSNISREQLQLHLHQATCGESVRFWFEIQLDDGMCNYVTVSIKPLLNHAGSIEMLLVEAQDISKIKLAEQAVRENENQLRLVYEENPSLLMTLDLKGHICTLNRAAYRLLGYRASDLLGKSIAMLYVDPELQRRLPAYLNYALRMGTKVKSRETCYLSESGKELWFKETLRKLPGKKQFLLVGEDITENRELSQRLTYQANHDFLTGLYNRSHFEWRLTELIEQTQDSDAQHALFYLDLDQFKVINDTFGHNAGDEAIVQVSRLFQQLLPEEAQLARLGGDEFGLIYPNCSRNQATELGESLLSAISEFHFLWQEQVLSVGCSIGLVLIDRHSGMHNQVLSAADTACYAAKDEGRNRLHLYKPDDIELQKRKGEMEWVARVQAAMREQRFCLYAQLIRPVVAEKNSSYLHYEVLARMIDERGELVPPSQILPAIEHYDMADKLDRILVEKTLLWLQNNPKHIRQLDVCSINLSGQSVSNPDFVDYLVTLLSGSGLPMDKLCFEITETTAIANFGQASKLISQLHQLGCKVALDDFGSGLSSFGYLKQLDVDYLKIDGMFIRDIATDKRDYAIVRSINELSKTLGKKTIAEYVEDKAGQALLEQIGVDYVQGYFLGRPLPLEVVALAHSSPETFNMPSTEVHVS